MKSIVATSSHLIAVEATTTPQPTLSTVVVGNRPPTAAKQLLHLRHQARRRASTTTALVIDGSPVCTSAAAGSKRRRSDSPSTSAKAKKTAAQEACVGVSARTYLLHRVEKAIASLDEDLVHVAKQVSNPTPASRELRDSLGEYMAGVRLPKIRPKLHMSDFEAPAEYATVAKDIQPGDLIFLGGTGAISRLIKVGTQSIWSHVGIVWCKVPKERLAPGVEEDWAYLECAQNGQCRLDYLRGKPLHGVQILTISEKLATGQYQDCAIRHLKTPLNSQQVALMEQVYAESRDAKFCTDMNLLFNTVKLKHKCKDVPWEPSDEAGPGVFCSQLIGEVFKRWGWLPQRPSSAIYTPPQFTEHGGLVNEWYGPEVFVAVKATNTTMLDRITDVGLAMWHVVLGRPIKT